MSNIATPDVAIALGLIVFVIAVFLVSRMEVLPRKSLPYVIAGLAAAVGIAVFRMRRMRNQKQHIEELEKALAEHEKTLAALRAKVGDSDAALNKALADLEQQKAAAGRALLQIQAKNEAEKERIDKLTGQELADDVTRALARVQ